MGSLNTLSRLAAGRTDLVLELLNQHDAAALPLAEDVPIIQWCAYYGDVTALRALLARGASLRELGEDLGLTAGAFHGHWRLCEFLLEHGANANFGDPSTGETPLHAALTNEDRDRYDPVVAVLLAAGADANAVTIAGVSTGSLMRDGCTKGESPLHRAAAFGTTDTIQMLLSAGADKTQKDCSGDTPLAWASWYRRPLDVLRALLYGSHRIHPNYTPLRRNLIGLPKPARLS